MSSHALPSSESKKSTASTSTASAQRQEKEAVQLVDNRAETALQWQFAGLANSPSYSLQAFSNQATPPPIQKKENNTGLPDQLKSGIENLSGYSMDDVRVHRNSDQPAQLQAHAFAQGTDIHLAPGQEKHLPHEAWHVVQQKQGKVKPTLQLKKEKVKVNDDATLEKEATVMGSKAYTETPEPAPEPIREEISSDPWAQIVQRKSLDSARLNVVGERHPESGKRREEEKDFIETKGISRAAYWKENEYKYTVKDITSAFGINLWTTTKEHFGDPAILRVEKRIGDTKEKLLPMVEEFVQGQLPEIFKNMEIELAWNSFTKHVVPMEIEQILLTMGELLKVTAEKPLVAKLGPFYAYLEARHREYNERDPVFTIQNDAKRFKEIWKKIEADFSKAVKGGAPLSPVDQVDKQRSDEMDKGAKQSADTKGVWKVGQSHVEDIKAAPGFVEGAANYNLMSREDFNSEYIPWIKLQSGAVVKDLWAECHILENVDKTNPERTERFYRRVAGLKEVDQDACSLLRRSHVSRFWVSLESDLKSKVISALNNGDSEMLDGIRAIFR